MFEDYHVHSNYSDDSWYPMENVVQDAIEMGMDEICFTDHVDYGIKQDWNELSEDRQKEAEAITEKNYARYIKPENRLVLNVDYPKYFAELKELEDKYKDSIRIKKGLEFGIQSHTIDKFQKLYDEWKSDLDFVLLSIHQVSDKEFWTGDFQRNRTQEEYQMAYYEELLRCIEEFDDFSVAAHLDLINRYDPAGLIEFSKVEPMIKKILEKLIEKGKGIEINTSSVRYKLGDLQPSKKILEMYRDLGGEIITFGSDSHKPEHLGKYIQEQKEMLKDLGFQNYYTFEKMQPIAHPL